jgi:CBS domain-containing protein/hemerythrin
MPAGSDDRLCGMTTIEQLMTRVVIALQQSQSAGDAEKLMKQHAVRHLAVLDDNKLVGVVSERDLVTAGPSARLPDVMTADPITVRASDPAHEAVVLMLQHRFNSLPVVDDGGALIGIVTSTDVMMLAYEALTAQAGQEPEPAQAKRRQVEHTVLRAKLERVENASYPHSLAFALSELGRFLERHFGREESDMGLFSQVVAMDSKFEPEVAKLREQHTSIRTRIAELTAVNRERGEDDDADVSPGIAELIKTIEEHEGAEAALIGRSIAKARY